MSLLSIVIEYFFGITGLLFLLAAIGMAFDPEYAGSAPGGVVLAVFCFVIAAVARFRSGAKRAALLGSSNRYVGTSLGGAHAFCEYCGAQWLGWGEVCGSCGRRRSSSRMIGGTPGSGSPVRELRRAPLPQKLRYEVLRRDGFTCQYCGRKPPEVELEVDHIDPVSAGGPDEVSNLITSCKDCNRGKGADALFSGSREPRPRVIVQREVREREIVKVKCTYCGSLNDQTVTNCCSCGARL